MTYYEELGISNDAAEEEIRQAHRRLVKLLHPDQQQDRQLRRMAELQLTRVNAFVEQLLDPAQRKLYDLTLRTQALSRTSVPAVARYPLRPEILLKGWRLAAGGVALVAAIAMFSASSPTDVVRSATSGSSPAVSQTPRVESGVPPGDVPRPPKIQSSPRPVVSTLPVSHDGEPVAETSAKADTPSAVETRVPEAPSVVSEALPAVLPPPPPQKTLVARSAFAGVWLYAGGERTENDKGLYKPEYIELRLSEAGGQLHGEYRSRYAVTDLPISPAVNFSFDGPAVAAQFQWKGPKASAGTIAIKLIHANAMQVDWKVSDAGGSGTGLQFGTAVLVRRL